MRRRRLRLHKPQAYESPLVDDYQGATVDRAPVAERGIYENLAHPPGMRSFEVVKSNGELLLQMDVADRLVDDQMTSFLRSILASADPVRTTLVGLV